LRCKSRVWGVFFFFFQPIWGNCCGPGVFSRVIQEERTYDCKSGVADIPPHSVPHLITWGVRILIFHVNGRAASGGGLAPKPLRASRNQALSILTVILSVIHTSHVPLVCVPFEPCGSAWKRRGKRSNGRAVCITPMFLMGNLMYY